SLAQGRLRPTQHPRRKDRCAALARPRDPGPRAGDRSRPPFPDRRRVRRRPGPAHRRRQGRSGRADAATVRTRAGAGSGVGASAASLLQRRPRSAENSDMGAMEASLRAFTEEPAPELSEPVPPEGRVQTAEFVLLLSATPTHASVARVRTTEERLDETI